MAPPIPLSIMNFCPLTGCHSLSDRSLYTCTVRYIGVLNTTCSLNLETSQSSSSGQCFSNPSYHTVAQCNISSSITNNLDGTLTLKVSTLGSRLHVGSVDEPFSKTVFFQASFYGHSSCSCAWNIT